MLDDGRGLGRKNILRHPHEKATGRTSSMSSHLLGLDGRGQMVPGNHKQQAEIVAKSSHLVTLIDLAGHEKYLKTTVEGVSRGMADYALILVNAMQPPTHMTLHHLNLCVTFGIPVIVVMTKVGTWQTSVCHLVAFVGE
jgi:elongation factor 1-alpha